MKKKSVLFFASVFLLGACNTDDNSTSGDDTDSVSTVEEADDSDLETENESNDRDDTDTTDSVDETDTNSESDAETDDIESFEYEDLDEETQAELDQDWENIDWENVRLTRDQFDAVLYDVQDNLNLQTGEDEEQAVYIENIDFDGETIEITLINNQQSEIADFATGMYAWVIDSFYRQLYLSSEYSNWEVQPRIIIIDQNGEVITDQMEFITFEE